MRKTKLCIPIYFDKGNYPSGGTTSTKRKMVYWRTIAVLCSSVKRAKIQSCDIVVCVNEDPPPDVADILKSCDVEVVSPAFSFQPPKGLYPYFSGAFYLFDCLKYCESLSKEYTFMFMDPDCIVMTGLDLVTEHSNHRLLIGYDLKLTNDYIVNGCSINALDEFCNFCRAEMGSGTFITTPKYYGGELYIMDGETLQRVNQIIDFVWKMNIYNYNHKKITLKTEEHVMSVALALLGGGVGFGEAMIKRMWTRPSFRNVLPEDRAYSIWHLPGEKLYAFQTLFRLLENDMTKITNLSENSFRDLVATLVRLEPSFLESFMFSNYPLLKVYANRLIARFR